MQFIDHASLGGKSISLLKAADAGRATTAVVHRDGTLTVRSNPVPGATFATDHGMNPVSAFLNQTSPEMLDLLFPELPEIYWSDLTALSEQLLQNGQLSCSGQVPNLNF